jgi:alpha-glucosidase
MRRVTHFPQFGVPSNEPALPFEPLGAARVVEQTETSVRLQTTQATVEVRALAPDLFRVGMFEAGQPVDYRSDAVATTDWPPHPVELVAEAETVRVGTTELAAQIRLEPLRVGFVDAQGRIIADDDPILGMGFAPLAPPEARLIDPLGAPARIYKRHISNTRYFGCGERTGGLDKTGSRQVFWNTDPPREHTASLNNLYTSVPFVLALHEGQMWGMFVDSGHRIEFDLAREEPTRCGFGVDGGPLVYYVFGGPTPSAVLERYTQLTGRTPMPPRWALGNHQSRWGYKTADEILSVARNFRERGLPLDALYLDIDYMRGYRVFTWDPDRFPEPRRLVQELARLGIRLVTIVDPGVKVDEDYSVYRSGREQDLFCKTFTGDEYRNVVWPGMCAFPDFTNPVTRAWWAEQHRELLDVGVAGIWCDMNEPSAFVPSPGTLPMDATHHGDGRAKLHAEVHNLYGQLMARSANEAMRSLTPDRRPMVISRSGFAGLQRYALHWTGDNSSWWEHLWMSMPQLQNLGLSGYAWVGVDVGGFSGDATGELLTRWTEFGIFQPFCRNHSAWDTHPQEPWAFGEPFESAIRELLLLRQRLMPYLYTLFEEAHRTGSPILRPLLFEWPDDEETYARDDQFMLGRALLVAPIARPGTTYRHVYVPHGTWVQLWSGARIIGPTHALAHAPLGRPAVYVRANTPVPMWPAMLHERQRPADPLTWLICLADAEPGHFEVFEDAGEGFGFERGEVSRTRVTCHVTAESIEVRIGARVGAFEPTRRSVELELRGVLAPESVVIDGSASTAWEHADQRLVVQLTESAAERVVEVRAQLA